MHLQLAHPFPGQAEIVPDRLERLGRPGQPEVPLDHESFAVRKRADRAPDDLAKALAFEPVDQALRVRIGDQLAELGLLALLPDGLVEREGATGESKGLVDKVRDIFG